MVQLTVRPCGWKMTSSPRNDVGVLG